MKWFGNKARRHRKGHQGNNRCERCKSLNEAVENEHYLILNNPDKKTNEMGLHAGAKITVKKNHDNDSNIIIAIGDSRYIIPRELAREIRIQNVD